MDAHFSSTDQFVQAYIGAWSTEDAAKRQQLVTSLYAEDAAFYAHEPGDGPIERYGVADITVNIAGVNGRLVRDNGLRTESTGFVVNHDVLKVSWRMLSSDGHVALTGMNLLRRDASGRIVQDYIFIG